MRGNQIVDSESNDGSQRLLENPVIQKGHNGFAGDYHLNMSNFEKRSHQGEEASTLPDRGSL